MHQIIDSAISRLDGLLGAGLIWKEFYHTAASNSLMSKLFSNTMVCTVQESLGSPLDDMHDRQTGVFDELVPEGPLGLGRKASGLDPFDVMSYIFPFSMRNLTFEEGKISAINGLLHAYERCKYPVYHIMGVSVLPPVRPHDNGVDLDPPRHIGNVYTWLAHTRAPISYKSTSRTPAKGFLAGLTWFCNIPGTRE